MYNVICEVHWASVGKGVRSGVYYSKKGKLLTSDWCITVRGELVAEYFKDGWMDGGDEGGVVYNAYCYNMLYCTD